MEKVKVLPEYALEFIHELRWALVDFYITTWFLQEQGVIMTEEKKKELLDYAERQIGLAYERWSNNVLLNEANKTMSETKTGALHECGAVTSETRTAGNCQARERKLGENDFYQIAHKLYPMHNPNTKLGREKLLKTCVAHIGLETLKWELEQAINVMFRADITKDFSFKEPRVSEDKDKLYVATEDLLYQVIVNGVMPTSWVFKSMTTHANVPCFEKVLGVPVSDFLYN